MRAPVIGAMLLGLLAAASLLWTGGDGPGALLGPERLGFVLPAAWLVWCLLAAGRPGAAEGTAMAAPALLAGVTLSPDGLAALPGALAVLAAGGAWWKAAELRPDAREHLLAAGAALLLAPPMLGALWAAAGLGGGPLPASASPIATTAPAWWSAAGLALGAGLVAWRSQPVTPETEAAE
ncbi:MAG: hypothetical protein ACYTGX_09815 [Planctomycetota bacterium]